MRAGALRRIGPGRSRLPSSKRLSTTGCEASVAEMNRALQLLVLIPSPLEMN
jgi:hypothetical protein